MCVCVCVCVCVCTIFSLVPRPLPCFQCLGRLGPGRGYTIVTSCHSTKAIPQCHSIGGDIGRVKKLTIQPTNTSASSTLQVSWSKPFNVNLLKLRGETYHLTLNSIQGTHTFNVSNSVKILSGVVDKAYYSKTIISLLATTFTDQYCQLISSGIQAIFLVDFM